MVSHFPKWMLELQGNNIRDWLELGPIIGHGAFGVVYVGVGTGKRYTKGFPVAVKVLSTVALDKGRRRQIEHEILCHRRVSAHPNIVTIHDCLEDVSALFMIMDMHSEGDMFKCIAEDELYVGNDVLIKEAFSQLLDAVEFCHGMGVYHRDLKPGKWLLLLIYLLN
jgi:serine/threonine protein kinase